ncbi:MAG: hypothetical protein QOD61_1150 [Solirubrobacteraceae bacterium]|nr:hypothetical protein [Solirubrobacteraceae bacterium]
MIGTGPPGRPWTRVWDGADPGAGVVDGESAAGAGELAGALTAAGLRIGGAAGVRTLVGAFRLGAGPAGLGDGELIGARRIGRGAAGDGVEGPVAGGRRRAAGVRAGLAPARARTLARAGRSGRPAAWPAPPPRTTSPGPIATGTGPGAVAGPPRIVPSAAPGESTGVGSGRVGRAAAGPDGAAVNRARAGPAGAAAVNRAKTTIRWAAL